MKGAAEGRLRRLLTGMCPSIYKLISSKPSQATKWPLSSVQTVPQRFNTICESSFSDSTLNGKVLILSGLELHFARTLHSVDQQFVGTQSNPA